MTKHRREDLTPARGSLAPAKGGQAHQTLDENMTKYDK